jgi:soluble lytic murein transglycosylase-like protein
MIIKIILLTVFCLVPLSGYAGIYGYTDDNGVYHFTNMIPVGKKYHVVVEEASKTVSLKSGDNSFYDKLILQHSQTHGVDPSLIKAVMKAESNFNPQAVSHKGAQGLMQLMPDTARLVRVENPFDPDENIRGGAKYLRLLDDTFRGNLELVLAAYNAGPQKVIDHKMNVPPIEETKNFIKRVKSYYNKLKSPHEG